MYSTILLAALATGGLFGRSSCENGNCSPELDATPSNVQTAQFRMRGRRRMGQREPQRDPSFVAPAPEPVMEPVSEDDEVEREASIRRLLREYAAPVPSQTGVESPQISREAEILARLRAIEESGDQTPMEEIIAMIREAIVHAVADATNPPSPGVFVVTETPQEPQRSDVVATISPQPPPEGWAVPGSLGALVITFVGLAFKYRV